MNSTLAPIAVLNPPGAPPHASMHRQKRTNTSPSTASTTPSNTPLANVQTSGALPIHKIPLPDFGPGEPATISRYPVPHHQSVVPSPFQGACAPIHCVTRIPTGGGGGTVAAMSALELLPHHGTLPSQQRIPLDAGGSLRRTPQPASYRPNSVAASPALDAIAPSAVPGPKDSPGGNQLAQLVRSGKKFIPSKQVHKDPKSLAGTFIVSPRNHAFRIEKLLQSAIYGGVFLAREFIVADQAQPPRRGTKALRSPSPEYPNLLTRQVAMKIMLRELEKRHRGQLQEDIMAELRFQKEMTGHVNVLSYDETWEDREAVYIVMQFAEFEDLFEVLKRRKVPFTEKETRWLFSQLLEAGHFLHSRCIAFRDHSLENVLMFRNPEDGCILPKITDPGQAVNIAVDSHGRVRGLIADRLFGKSFRAPEVYTRKPYNPVKVDTFCLGWMLFFTLTKHQAFDRAMDSDPHWTLIKKGRHAELLRQRGGTHLSPQVCDLMWKMLAPDFADRPTPQQCLYHPWFKNAKCPVDDRTIYAQTGATSDHLPLHPILLKRQQHRLKLQGLQKPGSRQDSQGACPSSQGSMSQRTSKSPNIRPEARTPTPHSSSNPVPLKPGKPQQCVGTAVPAPTLIASIGKTGPHDSVSRTTAGSTRTSYPSTATSTAAQLTPPSASQTITFPAPQPKRRTTLESPDPTDEDRPPLVQAPGCIAPGPQLGVPSGTRWLYNTETMPAGKIQILANQTSGIKSGGPLRRPTSGTTSFPSALPLTKLTDGGNHQALPQWTGRSSVSFREIPHLEKPKLDARSQRAAVSRVVTSPNPPTHTIISTSDPYYWQQQHHWQQYSHPTPRTNHIQAQVHTLGSILPSAATGSASCARRGGPSPVAGSIQVHASMPSVISLRGDESAGVLRSRNNIKTTTPPVQISTTANIITMSGTVQQPLAPSGGGSTGGVSRHAAVASMVRNRPK